MGDPYAREMAQMEFEAAGVAFDAGDPEAGQYHLHEAESWQIKDQGYIATTPMTWNGFLNGRKYG